MKKLICALMLAALLVPAMAMAGDYSNVPTTLDLKSTETNWSKYNFQADGAVRYRYDDHLSVTYYMSTGRVRDYEYNADCGCHFTITPSGHVSDITRDANQFVPGLGNRYMWNREEKHWRYMGVQQQANQTEHDPTVGHALPKLPVIKNTLTVGPDDLTQYMNSKGVTYTFLEDGHYGGAYEGFKDEKADAQGDLTLTLSDEISEDCDVILLNGVKVAYTNNSDPKEIRAGGFRENQSFQSLVLIDTDKDFVTVFRVSDSSKGPVVRKGVYAAGLEILNSDAGVLKLDGTQYFRSNYEPINDVFTRVSYGVLSDDYSSITSFDRFNRMELHEYWDSAFTYWCYEDGEWLHSAHPDMPWTAESETPSDEVLRSLNLSGQKISFNLSDAAGEEGVPAIQTKLNGADDVKVISFNNPDNEEITTFDITPMKAGQELKVNQATEMYLPLPNGFDKALAEEYKVTINHEGEIFSSIDGSATITDQGILISLTHFSPFEVMWGATAVETFANKPMNNAALPQTGDDSNLALFAGLMMASAAALFVMGQRREN